MTLSIRVSNLLVKIQPNKLLSVCKEFWDRMIYPEKYGFDRNKGPIMYELSSDETVEGVIDTLKFIDRLTYRRGEKYDVSVYVAITLSKWMYPYNDLIIKCRDRDNRLIKEELMLALTHPGIVSVGELCFQDPRYHRMRTGPAEILPCLDSRIINEYNGISSEIDPLLKHLIKEGIPSYVKERLISMIHDDGLKKHVQDMKSNDRLFTTKELEKIFIYDYSNHNETVIYRDIPPGYDHEYDRPPAKYVIARDTDSFYVRLEIGNLGILKLMYRNQDKMDILVPHLETENIYEEMKYLREYINDPVQTTLFIKRWGHPEAIRYLCDSLESNEFVEMFEAIGFINSIKQ